MRTSSGSPLVLNLPDTPWPEANRLLQDYRDVLARRSSIREELQKAYSPQAQWQAKQGDLEAAAAALSKGQGLPPDTREDAVARRAEALQAQSEAEALNLDRAAQALVDHVEQHREEYLADIAEQIAAAAQVAAEQVSALAFETLGTLLAWRSWLERWPHKMHVLVPARLSVSLGGQTHPPGRVFEALALAAGTYLTVEEEIPA